jgi:hypothetical protein
MDLKHLTALRAAVASVDPTFRAHHIGREFEISSLRAGNKFYWLVAKYTLGEGLKRDRIMSFFKPQYDRLRLAIGRWEKEYFKQTTRQDLLNEQ